MLLPPFYSPSFLLFFCLEYKCDGWSWSCHLDHEGEAMLGLAEQWMNHYPYDFSK